MNQREFIAELKRRLAGFKREDVAEVTAGCSERVADFMREGKTEEEAVAALGDPTAAAKSAARELYARPAGGDRCARELTLSAAPDTVRVRVKRSGIFVCPSRDDKLRIKYRGTRFRKFAYRDVGGVAEFSSARRGPLSALAAMLTRSEGRGRPVVVELPAGFSGRVELNSGRGTVAVYGIEAGCLYVRAGRGKVRFESGRITHTADLGTASGRIDTEDVTCQRLSASSKSGSVTGRGVTAETYSGRTAKGPIYLSGIDAGEINLFTARGSVTATVRGLPGDYAAEAETAKGAALIQGRTAFGPVNPGAKRKIRAKTASGGIRIDFVPGV